MKLENQKANGSYPQRRATEGGVWMPQALAADNMVLRLSSPAKPLIFSFVLAALFQYTWISVQIYTIPRHATFHGHWLTSVHDVNEVVRDVRDDKKAQLFLGMKHSPKANASRKLDAKAAVGGAPLEFAASKNKALREKPSSSGRNKSITREINDKEASPRRHYRLGWDPGRTENTVIPLKVKLPIFVASLPKSGTTSVWQYFTCGGHKANHQWIKKKSNHAFIQLGQCIRDNVQADRPPFQGCGGHDIFTDTGYANYDRQISNCYYPSVDALESIYKYYPQSTIIVTVRNTTEWYKSMKAWDNGSLLDRWRPCNTTGFPPFASRAKDFKRFYEWHTQNLRDFAASHPSMTYIELALESPKNGRILEEKVGIPARCWGKCTPSSKFCEPIPAAAKF